MKRTAAIVRVIDHSDPSCNRHLRAKCRFDNRANWVGHPPTLGIVTAAFTHLGGRTLDDTTRLVAIGGQRGLDKGAIVAKDRVDRDDEDLVRLYLTDIGQYTLLTKDDEVRLA